MSLRVLPCHDSGRGPRRQPLRRSVAAASSQSRSATSGSSAWAATPPGGPPRRRPRGVRPPREVRALEVEGRAPVGTGTRHHQPGRARGPQGGVQAGGEGEVAEAWLVAGCVSRLEGLGTREGRAVIRAFAARIWSGRFQARTKAPTEAGSDRSSAAARARLADQGRGGLRTACGDHDLRARPGPAPGRSRPREVEGTSPPLHRPHGRRHVGRRVRGSVRRQVQRGTAPASWRSTASPPRSPQPP